MLPETGGNLKMSLLKVEEMLVGHSALMWFSVLLCVWRLWHVEYMICSYPCAFMQSCLTSIELLTDPLKDPLSLCTILTKRSVQPEQIWVDFSVFFENTHINIDSVAQKLDACQKYLQENICSLRLFPLGAAFWRSQQRNFAPNTENQSTFKREVLGPCKQLCHRGCTSCHMHHVYCTPSRNM